MATFVVVPGGWTDGRSWLKVQQQVSRLGHESIVATLPAHGDDYVNAVGEVTLDDYVHSVISTAALAAVPVILVGHSTAGIIVSMAAERRPDLFAQLVYVAGFLLKSGQSWNSFVESSPSMSGGVLVTALRKGNGVLSIDPFAFIRVFCADADADDAGNALNRLRPQPLKPLTTPITVRPRRWGTLQRTYIHTAFDDALTIAAQHEMITEVGVDRTATLYSTHCPMLSQSNELAGLLVNIATTEPTGAPSNGQH